MREVFNVHPDVTPALVDERTTGRLDPSEDSGQETAPRLWIILDQYVLRREVGSRKVMEGQLRQPDRPTCSVPVVLVRDTTNRDGGTLTFAPEARYVSCVAVFSLVFRHTGSTRRPRVGRKARPEAVTGGWHDLRRPRQAAGSGRMDG